METVAAIRAQQPPWQGIFSADCHVTSSRRWPVPDFVLDDRTSDLTTAAEFKPPGQTKREYLTGVGQALAYTKDFDYALLIVPDIADDGHRIGDHIRDVLGQDHLATVPVGLLTYDPAIITPSRADANVARFFQQRASRPTQKARVDESFYAKWREMSAEEMACFLRHLYREQTAPSSTVGNIRDRAWDGVWADIQAGLLHHWGGGVRHYNASQKINHGKNWRNFITHIGWMESDGALTTLGLKAHHTALIYGANSQMFLEIAARSLLLEGKHLILISAINEFQDRHLASEGQFDDEGAWLDGIEAFLEAKGLLKRNPGRAAAAVQHAERGFLKAEKQLWKSLGLIIPRGARGGRVFHPGRGFMFDWARITRLVRG